MDCMAQIPWLVLSLLSLVSILYVIVGAQAFDILGDIEDLYEHAPDDDHTNQVKSNLRGGRAALVLSMMVVLIYVGYSFIMTYGKWFSEAALKGVMFGVLLTASLYTSAFMLLTGVILEANDLAVELNRSDEKVRSFRASYVIAYTMTAIYLILFLFQLYQRIYFMEGWIKGNEQVTVALPSSTLQNAV